MKQLKALFLIVAAICISATLHAQQIKTKTKTKTKTETTQQTDSTKYQCPMKCEGEKTYAKAGKCPVCNMNLKEVKATATVYQCPMKCEGDKTYTQAGKCPVCNMNLKAQAQKSKTENSHSHNHS